MKGIIKGLITVTKHMFRKPVTVQYPEEPIPWHTKRFRGRVILNLDSCIGCTLCAQICPNHADHMVHYEYENGKNWRKIYPAVDIGVCTYCGLCQEICPTGSIRLSNEFELAHFDRDMDYLPDRLSRTETELKYHD
ncbi:MAG: NuoI/complex I 23 kDa subunit family protein [Thermoplasmata archaeon]|nr:NADH-quinone oxidoreductase subunit I [Thermoplasmata archaeon]